MAVSIMSACGRASVLFLGCFLQVLARGEVFQAPLTHDVFLRSKRANSYLLEEIMQGNLERECHEELCNYEEAREYFENTADTNAFWTVYYDGDQCKPNPCLHGGTCTDKVGGFLCSCVTPHHGAACELGGAEPPEPHSTGAYKTWTREIKECPTGGPKACDQLCTASYDTFTCSCLPGFKLQKDRRSCRPEVEFPCGRLPDGFNTTASLCRHGNCPWQVSLLSRVGVELCGGVVLGRFSVLTAARCLFLNSVFDPRPSNFFVVAGDGKMPVPVKALYIHNRFQKDHHDNDLVLLQLARPLHFGPALIHVCLPTKDFSENILMHSGKTGVAERRGVSRTQRLVYMTLDECRGQLNVLHPLSNKMFCMRTQSGPSGARNRVPRSPNGPSGHQNGTQRVLNGTAGNQNGTQESPNRPLRNQNGTQERLNEHAENQNENQNQTQNQQNGRTGTPNGAENNDQSQILRHKPPAPDGGLCGGLLPGTPVATVDRGTAFLTGLLMSSDCDGGGLVFTKLSRYLGWIKPRLEAAEDHMTAQVSLYPENR